MELSSNESQYLESIRKISLVEVVPREENHNNIPLDERQTTLSDKWIDPLFNELGDVFRNVPQTFPSADPLEVFNELKVNEREVPDGDDLISLEKVKYYLGLPNQLSYPEGSKVVSAVCKHEVSYKPNAIPSHLFKPPSHYLCIAPLEFSIPGKTKLDSFAGFFQLINSETLDGVSEQVRFSIVYNKPVLEGGYKEVFIPVIPNPLVQLLIVITLPSFASDVTRHMQ